MTLSVPVLNLFADRDHLVPPESSAALAGLVDRSCYEEMRFCGGHIGLIVSSRAQRELHPALGRWCDGYATIRGCWCEPLSADLVRQLNRRLANAKDSRRH